MLNILNVDNFIMINIKEAIGQRILQARKAKGLTRKALADLTDDLKQSRINNWERGERTPGAREVKQLAKALDVSAAWLMCLTDHKQSDPRKSIPGLGLIIPLLSGMQAMDPIETIKNIEPDQITFIPLSIEMSKALGKHAFALKVQDDSMDPDLKLHDVLIIDPDKLPQPGQLVVAKIEDNNDVIVRRYKQTSLSQQKQSFELLTTNTHWANLKDSSQCKLVGTVCGLVRSF